MSSFVPSHLRKYIVPQNYRKYSPEDQAVWRFIMRGIHQNLSVFGYKGALEGLKKTGIYPDQIPKITDIDKKLQKFGWRAACISGFIPPRAFMEFQMHKILPIASELRSIQHIFYTPAPDIVHEAVGHVPFLTNPKFSRFLEKYAGTVFRAIYSSEDMEKYKAIRDLSDLKENPRSTKEQIKKQEKKLNSVIKNISYTSESAYLSRLIWWTSEYGLMGTLKNPKVYGAGLISSIGETLDIKKVKKIPFGENCLSYPFDITDFQPQLFVAKNFDHLLEVLDTVAGQMAFQRGGLYAVNQALKSKSLNTVVLDSGLQISGVLERSINLKNKVPVFLKFKGPVQLSFKDRELKGHGKTYHKEGYSTPLRWMTKSKTPVYLWSEREIEKQGLKKGKTVQILFEGGIELKGTLKSFLRKKGRLILLSFKDCLIRTSSGEILYKPSWGPFDLAVGDEVISAFCGPADNKAYKQKDDFQPSKVPKRVFSKKQKTRFEIYKRISRLKKISDGELKKQIKEIQAKEGNWLMFLELLNLVRKNKKQKELILQASTSVSQKKLQNRKIFKLGLDFFKL